MPAFLHTFLHTWFPPPPPVPAPARDRPMMVLGAACCGVLLSVALKMSYGVLDEASMYLLTLALLCALVGLALPPKARYERFAQRALPVVLLTGLVINAGLAQITHPGMQVLMVHRDMPTFFHTEMDALLICGLLGLSSWPPMRRWHVPLMVGVAFLLGDWIIVSSPSPRIDLIPLHIEALSALLSGHNPFAITFPNVYGHAMYYGPGLVQGDRVMFGYDYPPINLLMALPGAALGDFRYAMALAWAFGAGIIARVRPGPLATLAMLLVLTTPRGLMPVECGWVEPFAFFLFALLLYWTVHRPRWVPLALGLLLSSKQHMPLILPAAAAVLPVWHVPRKQIMRMIGAALAVGTVITLPFFLWSPSAFWHSVVEVMLMNPFRPDSLNYASWIYSFSTSDTPPSIWIGFALCVTAAVVVVGKAPRTVAGCAMGFGFIFFCFLTFNRQAFYNYYWFIVACMFTAVAVSDVQVPAESA